MLQGAARRPDTRHLALTARPWLMDLCVKPGHGHPLWSARCREPRASRTQRFWPLLSPNHPATRLQGQLIQRDVYPGLPWSHHCNCRGGVRRSPVACALGQSSVVHTSVQIPPNGFRPKSPSNTTPHQWFSSIWATIHDVLIRWLVICYVGRPHDTSKGTRPRLILTQLQEN